MAIPNFTRNSSDNPRRVGHNPLPERAEKRVAKTTDMENDIATRPLETSSARMRLVALTDRLAAQQLADREGFFEALGVEFEPAWPPEFASDRLLSQMSARLSERPEDCGWYQWVYISPVLNRLAGLGGFTGPPNASGEVEIGYSMLTSYREQGLATEGVTTLMDWAYAHADVSAIIAHTPVENLAAQRVLEKAGFVMQGPPIERRPDELVRRFRHCREAGDLVA